MEELEMVQTILWFILCGCLFMIGALAIYWLAVGRKEQRDDKGRTDN